MWLCGCDQKPDKELEIEAGTSSTDKLAGEEQTVQQRIPAVESPAEPPADASPAAAAPTAAETETRAKVEGSTSTAKKKEDEFWEVIFSDEATGDKVEYLPSKHVTDNIPGKKEIYKTRAINLVGLSVEDALLCFMDFSQEKLKFAKDYKDIKTEKIVRCTGALPGGLPEESIVTITINFTGFLILFKPFFPAKMTLRLTLDEDPARPGHYRFSQQTLTGPDGQPDGKSKKEGSIEPDLSGDPSKCRIGTYSEVPSWVPLWIMKSMLPKVKSYIQDYVDRYLAHKKTKNTSS